MPVGEGPPVIGKVQRAQPSATSRSKVTRQSGRGRCPTPPAPVPRQRRRRQEPSNPIRSASGGRVGVGHGFPERGDGGAVERQVVVAPRPHQVKVLELRRCRQDVVGVASRVGQKLLVDDGEQVVPAQAFQHQPLIGSRSRRIGVPDDRAP